MAVGQKAGVRRTAVRASDTDKSASETKLRLDMFGAYLHELRVKHVQASQTQIADKLRKLKCDNPTQSLVAQLETGRITNPSPELLRALAEAYKARSYEALLAVFIQNKFGISPAKADILGLDIRDIKGLAEWEKNLKPEELWIVAPNFVDNDNTDIQDAVFANLERATCTLTYFVDDLDLAPNRRFGELLVMFYRMRNQVRPRLRGKVRWFGLTAEEPGLMASSFVIANPQYIYRAFKAEGYTVIPFKNKPRWGIRMDEDDVKARVQALNSWMAQKENGEPSVGEKGLMKLLPPAAVQKRELNLSDEEVRQSHEKL